MIEAYVTNLGKYNEGQLVGEFLKLPATTEEVQSLLRRIGIDGVRYEEIFITDYESNIPGLHDCLGEYENLDELNYLASLLTDLDDWKVEKFAAAVELGDNTDSVADLINLAQNLECYEFYPGVENDEDLGRYLIDELEWEQIPDKIAAYFDYEAYGKDFAINECGDFYHSGYVSRNDVSMEEHYSSRDDIPEEYQIFAYPKPEKASILETLKSCQQCRKSFAPPFYM